MILKLGVVSHNYNPSTWEQHTKLQTNLDYKAKKNKIKLNKKQDKTHLFPLPFYFGRYNPNFSFNFKIYLQNDGLNFN